nr:HAMP domain-containing sensor histidine kinase [Brevibacterium renqingii]
MRSREEFTASVSHELRTPLTSIIGYTELALDELVDDPATEHSAAVGHLGVIQRNSEQLFALVEDILLEQQAGSHRLRLQRTDLDLGALIEEVIGALCPAATEHGVRLSLGEIDHLHINADEKRLTQVLTNLVFNGIKYSGTGRTVTVRSAVEAAGIGFDVVDDGRGIDSADLDRLFSPFFRGTAAQTSTKRGVGLGLAVTKSIVDAHGGTITVDSALGRGTRFSVRIPTTGEGATL